MTSTSAPTTSFNPARFTALLAGTLAVFCLLALTYMTFQARQVDHARNLNDMSECINRAAYSEALSVDTCMDRYRAGTGR